MSDLDARMDEEYAPCDECGAQVPQSHADDCTRARRWMGNKGWPLGTPHPTDFPKSTLVDYYRNRCRWCARPNEGNAGDYYHNSQCAKNYLSAVLRDAERRGAAPIVIKYLKARYESEAYVGD